MYTSQIKQYKNKILTNVLSSQFIYSSIHQKCELKKQELIIQSKKKKKIHYLYLFLTANKRPFAKKHYTFSKNLTKKNSSGKLKSIDWHVEIKKDKFYQSLYRILFEIIPYQTNAEKKILKLQQKHLDLIINFAPLTAQTLRLKPLNGYLSDIPLLWRLKWTNSSLFQKIFILKHLQILNSDVNFKHLESELE